MLKVSYKDLKHVRENKGISLEEFSNMTKISMRRLKTYEEDSVEPKKKTLKFIAQCLGIDLDKEDSYSAGLNPSSTKYSSIVYESCCNKLYQEVSNLMEKLFDGENDLQTILIIRDKINDLTDSIAFNFRKASISENPFDEYLIEFTLKNTLSNIINGFNMLKSINNLLDKNSNDDPSIIALRAGVRNSVHDLRYVFYYLNDYFRVESDRMFILEKSDGTVGCLNDFQSKASKSS